MQQCMHYTRDQTMLLVQHPALSINPRGVFTLAIYSLPMMQLFLKSLLWRN